MSPYVEISLKGFCALGGLTNPKLMTSVLRDGRGNYLRTIYWFKKF